MDNLKQSLFIVMADDDLDDQLIFDQVVKEISEDIRIEFCLDGQLFKTWSEATLEIPDFIFLDINMPKCSGLDCLLDIRGKEKFDKSVLIMFSTSVSPHDVKLAYERKANLYLVKPNSVNKLKEDLQKIFSMDWSEPLPFSEFTVN